MKALVKQPNVALQVQQTITWLQDIRKMVESMDDPEEVITRLREVEILEVLASKTKMDEILQEAAFSILELQRRAGRLFGPAPGKGRPSGKLAVANLSLQDFERMKVDPKTVTRWRKLAGMPDYVYKHGLEATDRPSVNSVLSQNNRYVKLKVAVDAADLVNKKAVLKKYVVEEYTPIQAEAELHPDDEDDEDAELFDFGGEDTEEEPDISEFDSVQTDMDAFAGNAEALENIVLEIEGVFKDITSIKKKTFDIGVTALKKMRASIKKLTELFKDVKGVIEDD